MPNCSFYWRKTSLDCRYHHFCALCRRLCKKRFTRFVICVSLNHPIRPHIKVTTTILFGELISYRQACVIVATAVVAVLMLFTHLSYSCWPKKKRNQSAFYMQIFLMIRNFLSLIAFTQSKIFSKVLFVILFSSYFDFVKRQAYSVCCFHHWFY